MLNTLIIIFDKINLWFEFILKFFSTPDFIFRLIKLVLMLIFYFIYYIISFIYSFVYSFIFMYDCVHLHLPKLPFPIRYSYTCCWVIAWFFYYFYIFFVYYLLLLFLLPLYLFFKLIFYFFEYIDLHIQKIKLFWLNELIDSIILRYYNLFILFYKKYYNKKLKKLVFYYNIKYYSKIVKYLLFLDTIPMTFFNVFIIFPFFIIFKLPFILKNLFFKRYIFIRFFLFFWNWVWFIFCFFDFLLFFLRHPYIFWYNSYINFLLPGYFFLDYYISFFCIGSWRPIWSFRIRFFTVFHCLIQPILAFFNLIFIVYFLSFTFWLVYCICVIYYYSFLFLLNFSYYFYHCIILYIVHHSYLIVNFILDLYLRISHFCLSFLFTVLLYFYISVYFWIYSEPYIMTIAILRQLTDYKYENVPWLKYVTNYYNFPEIYCWYIFPEIWVAHYPPADPISDYTYYDYSYRIREDYDTDLFTYAYCHEIHPIFFNPHNRGNPPYDIWLHILKFQYDDLADFNFRDLVPYGSLADFVYGRTKQRELDVELFKRKKPLILLLGRNLKVTKQSPYYYEEEDEKN